ncbi:MAG: hypothetical protein ACRDPS_23880 [Nocardioides sp.]|uniref:hypothetical protein n=1 Tax=Nocardioides sp. TaxID=35761 RepID=UPI003D6A34C9
MGAAVISGLFAVVLACLAWIFKNGSRRARLLTRIERYSQVLKDLPEGHPARVHLDAALAADSEQLLALTGWKAPETPRPPAAPQPSDPWYPPAQQPSDPWYPPSPRPAVKPGPAYPPAQRQGPVAAPAGAGAGAYKPAADDDLDDRDDIDWMGEDEEPGAPSPSPAAPTQPPVAGGQPSVAGAGQPSATNAFGPPPPPKRALLSGHGSTILWVLAGLSAVTAVGLALNDLIASPL